MNFEQLTLKNQEVLQEAVRLARTAGNAEVSPEHLAVALLAQEGGTAAALLGRIGLMVAACLGELHELLGRLPRTEGEVPEPRLSRSASRLFDLATEISREFRDDYVAQEHLLLAFVRDERTKAGELLRAKGLSEASLLAALRRSAAPPGFPTRTPRRSTRR